MGENIEGLSTREAADKAIDAIVQLSKDVGIPGRLEELDAVNEEDFEVLAENALKDACSLTNPRKGTKEDVISIFESAYYNKS